MFDSHMHTRVSYDATGIPEEMVEAAVKAGLKEICFTDHIDYVLNVEKQPMVFETADYNAAYDHLQDRDGLKIRRGLEFGLETYNREAFKRDLQRRPFDFVLGSIHSVEENDVYWKAFWVGRTREQAYLDYLEETLACVKVHDDFDVLAHLSYVSKSPENPNRVPIRYADYRELGDEILKELVSKGKGLELNTSGIDRCGDFLPTADFFCRFKELGGEIVTIGSDAHAPDRVGQYCDRACEVLKDIFGYVCTFEERKPIFHKL